MDEVIVCVLVRLENYPDLCSWDEKYRGPRGGVPEKFKGLVALLDTVEPDTYLGASSKKQFGQKDTPIYFLGDELWS